jgi:phosphoesterase RecJ-like protein
MIYTDVASAAPAFRQQIDAAQRILLLTHVNPDGDAIGSLLGAANTLRAFGKELICLLASPAPTYTARLPGAEWLTVYRRGDALPEADLTWMLDTATPARIGAISDEHLPALLARPLMITDHHVTNEGGGRINLIDPSAASNADLLFRLLVAMGLPVNQEAATCLYLGLITDTQSFQLASTTPQTLRTAADLLAAGANRKLVIDAVYFSIPESTMRLTSLALSSMEREGGLIWASIRQDQQRTVRAGDEAGDDTIMRMQRVAGMRIACLFKERYDGSVKISLRSLAPINVAAIAQLWGGGGHAQAAGATLQMDLDAAQAAVLPLLREALAEQAAG